MQATPHPHGVSGVFGRDGNWCKRCGTVWILGWNCSVGGVTGLGEQGRGRRGGGGGGANRVVKRVGVSNRNRKRKDDRSRNGDAGGHQKIVEWVCGGCGYVAKGEMWGGGSGGSIGDGDGVSSGKEKQAENKGQTKRTVEENESGQAVTETANRMPLAPEVSHGQGQKRGHTNSVLSSASVVGAGASLRGGLPTEVGRSANQRAKERRKKKNWSLLGILAAEREQERQGNREAGHGLGGVDLMDLMKLA